MNQENPKSQAEILLEAVVKQQSAFGEAVMSEVRRTRRSANLRTFGLIILIALFSLTGYLERSSGPQYPTIPRGAAYVSLLRITGTIEAGKSASFEALENQLYAAFHDPKSVGVLLDINSPGGSPVQADNLATYIRELKTETGKKVVVLGEDMLTSGAYMVAVAADRIYVNHSTMAGSIGVFQQSFGLQGVADKLGVEARTYFAGTHKRRLDPFMTVNPDDVSKVETVLHQIHQNFIEEVKRGRGSRLNGNEQELFSGDYWTGDEALTKGLVDGIASFHQVLKQEFNAEHAIDYTQSTDLLSGLKNLFAVSIRDSLHTFFAERGTPQLR